MHGGLLLGVVLAVCIEQIELLTTYTQYQLLVWYPGRERSSWRTFEKAMGRAAGSVGHIGARGRREPAARSMTLEGLFLYFVPHFCSSTSSTTTFQQGGQGTNNRAAGTVAPEPLDTPPHVKGDPR